MQNNEELVITLNKVTPEDSYYKIYTVLTYLLNMKSILFKHKMLEMSMNKFYG